LPLPRALATVHQKAENRCEANSNKDKEHHFMNMSGPNRRDRPNSSGETPSETPREHSPPRPVLLSVFQTAGWDHPILGTLQCAALRSEHKFHLKLFYRSYASE
jgi:hypothetical protein